LTQAPFTGKELDSETSLQYFGARYYMAALGRWGAVDPLADRMPGWSPYNYMMGAPTMGTDLDGRMPCWFKPEVCAFAIGAAFGFATELLVQLTDEEDGIHWGALGTSTVTGGMSGMLYTLNGLKTAGRAFRTLAAGGIDLFGAKEAADMTGREFTLQDAAATMGIRGGSDLIGGLVYRTAAGGASRASNNLGRMQDRIRSFGESHIFDSGLSVAQVSGSAAVRRGALQSEIEEARSFSSLVAGGGSAGAQIFNSIRKQQEDVPLPTAN
jgi:RHS repeat-associated protein